MSLTLYSENTMETPETVCSGPIRDAEADLSEAAAAVASAAAAIGRTADAMTSLITRVDRWAAKAETFATVYLTKLLPLLEQLEKRLP